MADNWKDDIIKTKLGGKKEWTDQERLELCHQLDKNLHKHINCLEKERPKPTNDGWTEDNWKERMAEHPIFAPYLEENEGKTDLQAPINELSEGLAQLKYDSEHNSPLEIAQNYKEEGLFHFKLKKYKFAIASFSEGLKQTFSDDLLRAQLYNNRAASHYHLGNYRSAIKDCESAVTLKSDYVKAIQRGVQSSLAIKSWDEAINWCDRGLQVKENYDSFFKQRQEAMKQKKIALRDQRRQQMLERRILEDNQKLRNAIIARNIRLDCKDEQEQTLSTFIEDLQPHHPTAKESPVHLTAEGDLVWPVLLLYPEYNESDCILEFSENSCFQDHLQLVFGNDSPPAPWDTECKYIFDCLEVYFEDSVSHHTLVSVNPLSSLKAILSDRRYLVKGGTPSFIILVRNSIFRNEFLSNYSSVL